MTEEKILTLGSLFDGIGGFILASKNIGIKPIWASEIEKFPIEVTKYHYPEVKHLGDITKLDGSKIEKVDIITAGSPCQDLSLAKKGREGLKGSKSSLFLEVIRIIKEMRKSSGTNESIYPRYFVWENVCGAFSSKISDVYLKKSVKYAMKEYIYLDLQRINGEWQGAWWEEVSVYAGGCLMLNISEWPKDAEECFLSQILEVTVQEKYYLSEKCCKGILRRVRRKGREIPKILEEALMKQGKMI